MPPLVFLGPQRFHPNLKRVLESLELRGPLAVITAGWQERESETDELREHVGQDVLELQLWRRSDDVLLRDRPLRAALHERQERLRREQDLYRRRLEHALAAARELFERGDRDDLLRAHRGAAVRAVRALDRQHAVHVARIHRELEERWRPETRPVVARHREHVRGQIERSVAVLVAGGHVAVLLNRMRLFGLGELVAAKPVVAWSAGAMALTERVVLFHDSPPQGAGDPEVLDLGLGLASGIVPLPHARRRLRLSEPRRVALFARRFAPAACVTLDRGARVELEGGAWRAGASADQLERGGRVEPLP